MTSSDNERNRQRVAASQLSHSNSNGGTRNSQASRGSRSGVRRRSYADWISRAIQSSPDCKMTLAAIYNWMASNVPGLYEKRNLHSSKGWKNAVRHTLSVNRRFKKINQPNLRAALWSIVESEAESDPGQSPNRVSSSESASVRRTVSSELITSGSSLFGDSIIVTTLSAIPSFTTPRTQSITSVSSSYLVPSSSSSLPSDVALSNPIVTQTLELHHQDGTVRTVTVPKPFPIHVVGDYRLVTIDPNPPFPVVTSG